MNIVLIGMSGAGKSTLGVILAKVLGKEFLDTDIVIQKAEGRLLQDIIDKDGTKAFLDIEEKIVSGLKLANCVVSTGGSVIYSEKVMKNLKLNSLIIYLYVPYKEIAKRLKNIKTRGIVMDKGKSLLDVYKEREPLYTKYSDVIINCAGKDVEKCISEVLKTIPNKICEECVE